MEDHQISIFDAAKKALRITVDAYDDEIRELIDAAIADLKIVDISWASDVTDPLVRRAIITYVRVFFGSPDDFERLKQAYDEQKDQLRMHRHTHEG